ncbi:MAG: hypothetical protein ABI809_08080 [Caldimonas sp.]
MAAERRPRGREKTLRERAARERWSVESRSGDVARLDIPAHASRERSFEIFCSFVVAHPGHGVARHGLRVLVDGAQQWARKVETDAGGRDTLDLRFRREVAVGRPLRLTVIAEVERALPLALSITADEDGD